MSKGKIQFQECKRRERFFEVSLSKPKQLYVDPVCRMVVNKEGTSYSRSNKSDILFYSQHCLETYLQNSLLN